MKKMKLFIPVLICSLFLSIGCNNSGNDESATKERTSPSDTIKSDPSKFSDPH